MNTNITAATANGKIVLKTCYRDISNGKSSVTLDVDFIIDGVDDLINVQIPVCHLTPKDIVRHIPDEFILLGEPKMTKARFVINTLEEARRSVPFTKRLVLAQGYNKLPTGEYVYALGSEILSNSKIDAYTTTANFASKYAGETCPHLQQLKWIYRMVNLPGSHPVLFLCAMVPYTRIILEHLGYRDYFVTYLAGETGAGKTTYAKLLVDIFNTAVNGYSLSSDKTDLRDRISRVKDVCFLLDDFNKNDDSPRTVETKTARVAELIQQASNSCPVVKDGASYQINSMLFITAEIVLKNRSTLNRCLIVPIEDAMDTDKVTYLQKNQGAYISFIKEYILWLCKNVTFLCSYAENTHYLRPSLNIDLRDYSGSPRIKRTETILTLTKNILMEFLFKRFPMNREQLGTLDHTFTVSIEKSIASTLEGLQKRNSLTSVEYAQVLLDHCSISSDIAPSYKEFCRANRKKADTYIFFVEDDCLCIKGEKLENLYRSKNDFRYKATLKMISKHLDSESLIRKQGGESSYPLKVSTTQQKNKRRYYHIPISALWNIVPEAERYAYSCLPFWYEYRQYVIINN